MRLLSRPEIEEPHACAYFPEMHSCRFRFFFADDVSGEELDLLLSSGWRKFSKYYFRPDCEGCARCVPVRVPVREFIPSKSQRRVIRKCSDFTVKQNRLEFRKEIFEMYSDHKKNRFNGGADLEDFIISFYMTSCPGMQTEYYLNGELAGVSFLDISSEALSSVYMIYPSAFEQYSPGTYSIIKEIKLAEEMGMKYYYLGYYIAENRSMSYKNRFFPHEILDWKSGKWIRIGKPGVTDDLL